MNLIDNYIYLIGKKLPLKGREDIKKELHSILLDNLEQKYGDSPTEEEVKSIIRDFGSPTEVAKKYSINKGPISPEYRDIYFLILKLVAGAMCIAFTTVFAVSLFTGNSEGTSILKRVLQIPLNALSGTLTATGVITFIFIIITNLGKKINFGLDDDWIDCELESVEIGDLSESKAEKIATLLLLFLCIIIVNFFPSVLVFFEDLFQKSGILLSHRINLEVFRVYALLISLTAVAEIAYYLILIKTDTKTPALRLYHSLISLADVVLFIVMLNSSALFILTESGTNSLIGYKLILLINIIVSSIEMLTGLGKIAKKRIELEMTREK